MNVYVAAPDHPIHQEPNRYLKRRVKYRGIVVADTVRAPVTVQLLDKQPRLTVSTIEDKRQALLGGRGDDAVSYGRKRYCGRCVVSPESTSEHMAWRRDSMGRKSRWFSKLFNGK